MVREGLFNVDEGVRPAREFVDGAVEAEGYQNLETQPQKWLNEGLRLEESVTP